MRLLITRPLEQAKKLGDLLEKNGFEVDLLPCLEILPIAPTPVNHKYYDYLIFTSPNSVNYLPNLFPQYNTITAIGQTTAECLNKKNLPCKIYPKKKQTSEGLLALDEFDQIENKKILIIKGHGGRQLLKDRLESRGGIVEYLDVYKRVIPKNIQQEFKKLDLNNIDLVICTSGETLENIYKYILEKKLVLSSERLEKLAKQLGFKNKIYVSENASNEAVLKQLKKINIKDD